MSESAYNRPGETVEETAAAAVTAGQTEMKAGQAAVAVEDYAIGAIAAYQTEGVYKVTSTATGEPAGSVGSPVWWDSSANKASLLGKTDAGDFLMGTLVEASAAAATVLYVALNKFPQDLPASLFAGKTIEVKTDNYTIDAQDTGKILLMNVDAKAFTLPATAAGLEFILMCPVADGGALMSVSPNAADKIMGPDVAGVDDKDYQLTKATQNQYDYLHIIGDGVAGWYVKAQRGTWAQEA